MDLSLAAPSRQTRITVWLALLLLAALAWAALIQQTQAMNGITPVAPAASSPDMSGMAGMNMSQGTTQSAPQNALSAAAAPVSILLYLPVWVIMMVAMMFPAVAPVVSLFATVSQKRRAAGQRAAPTWSFLAGYLAIWTLVGVVAYALSLVLPALGMMAPGLRIDYPVAAGVTLIAAGLYQFSPLKQGCLQQCRSPLSVILNGWRDGSVGAFRMGLEHGAYCLGCCWGLMLVLFVLGMMNLVGVVILTGIIFVEKAVPHGPLISKLTALALIGFGIITLI